MINRTQAMILLKKYVKTTNLIKHSLAVEAILKRTACYLRENEELWGLTGLLHDLDYDHTKDAPHTHASVTANLVQDLLPEEALHAIKAHNYQFTEQIPETQLDKALIAADAVLGLIIATALVMPSKKLREVTLKTLINKYKDKSFATGCNRKRIELCFDCGIDLEIFLELSLKALQNISEELGI
ncbi:MAG: HD domain-containing protein [Candidatus Thermoplasmatota archaeon]